MVMSLNPGDNHKANAELSEDKHTVERAFLRLGDILSEIADASVEKEAETRKKQETVDDEYSLTKK